MFVRSDDPYGHLCVSKHRAPEILRPLLEQLQVDHPDKTRIEYAELVAGAA